MEQGTDVDKDAEDLARIARGEEAGALAGVPVTLPALTRALKLQAKASKVGFDWNDPRAVLRKIREEADEIETELELAKSFQAIGGIRRVFGRGRDLRGAKNNAILRLRGFVPIGSLNLNQRGAGVHLDIGDDEDLADFSGKWGGNLSFHLHCFEHG